MGYEVRRVPANWKHPKGDPLGRSEYLPLFNGGAGLYEQKGRKWLDEAIAWKNGERPDYAPGDPTEFFWEWDGMPPDPEMHMLVRVPKEQLTHFQLYETVTEGTPVSPVFATLDELIDFSSEIWPSESRETRASLLRERP